MQPDDAHQDGPRLRQHQHAVRGRQALNPPTGQRPDAPATPPACWAAGRRRAIPAPTSTRKVSVTGHVAMLYDPARPYVSARSAAANSDGDDGRRNIVFIACDGVFGQKPMASCSRKPARARERST